MGDEDINTIWTMEYERAQAGTRRMAETMKGLNDEIKKVGKSSEGTFDTIRGWDRSLGQVAHMGKSLLSIFGIGGGLAGGVSFLANQFKEIQEQMSRTAAEVIKGGEGVAPLATMVPAGQAKQAVALATTLAGKYNRPIEGVSKDLAGFLAQGMDLEAAQTQVESQYGGPEAVARLARAGKDIPAVGAMTAVEQLRRKAMEGILAPTTAARKKMQEEAIQNKLERLITGQAFQQVGVNVGEEVGGLGEAYQMIMNVPSEKMRAFDLERALLRAEAGLPGGVESLRKFYGRGNPDAALTAPGPAGEPSAWGRAGRYLEKVAQDNAAATRTPR